MDWQTRLGQLDWIRENDLDSFGEVLAEMNDRAMGARAVVPRVYD